MPTIKERLTQIEKDRHDYLTNTVIPAVKQLQNECETEGHVNLQVIHQTEGPDYFVCDNCKKLVVLS